MSSIHQMDDLTQLPEDEDERDPLLAAFAVRLSELVEEKGLERNQALYRAIGKRFGLGAKGVEKWFLGRSWPRNPTLIALADWLGVSIDYLMSGRGPRAAAAIYSSKPISHVATVMAAMQPEQQYLAARLVDQVAQPSGNDGTHGGGQPKQQRQ